MKIMCSADALTEGLFGGVFIHVAALLPALKRLGIYPEWDIKSQRYGVGPHFTVIPGVVVPRAPHCLSESKVHFWPWYSEHAMALCDDWQTAHDLWTEYFSMPDAVHARSEQAGFDLSNALGVHYRGTDKNTDLLQTNPVRMEDFIRLMADFLRNRPVDAIYIATDEPSFIGLVEKRFPEKLVLSSGCASKWKVNNPLDFSKAHHAIFDCVMLSRCKHLLKCQSALSGFTKILNPSLDAYRVSSSKIQPWSGAPYWPDAYIPKLISEDPECQSILERQMSEDWTFQASEVVAEFSKPHRLTAPRNLHKKHLQHVEG